MIFMSETQHIRQSEVLAEWHTCQELAGVFDALNRKAPKYEVDARIEHAKEIRKSRRFIASINRPRKGPFI